MQTRQYAPVRHDQHAASQRDTRNDWRDDAACREMDTEAFFPDPSSQGQAAKVKTVCETRCPVVAECLAYALSCDSTLQGIFAGTTQRDRNGIRAAANKRGNGFNDTGDVRAWAAQQWGNGREIKAIALQLGVAIGTVQRWVEA